MNKKSRNPFLSWTFRNLYDRDPQQLCLFLFNEYGKLLEKGEALKKTRK